VKALYSFNFVMVTLKVRGTDFFPLLPQRNFRDCEENAMRTRKKHRNKRKCNKKERESGRMERKGVHDRLVFHRRVPLVSKNKRSAKKNGRSKLRNLSNGPGGVSLGDGGGVDDLCFPSNTFG
jgi:hypothetical protein